MRKFIRKHQKKFIAFVMIVLMISFAASSGNRTANNHGDQLVGHIGKAKVLLSEAQESHQEWGVLRQNIVFESTNRYTQEPSLHSILETMFPIEVLQNDRAADLFMLLRHEARDAGVRANMDEVESIRTNHYHRPPGADEIMDDVARDAITDFLLIRANFDRLANNVKVSLPERDHFLGQAMQQIQLNVVELNQSDFAAKIVPPTTQQAEDQFNKYADVVPGNPDEKNPFGFGYRLPNGVKLQYLLIKKNEISQVVEATQSAYDWDVKARLYYRQHKDEFTTAPPATMAMGPTSQPTAQSYTEVASEALAKLRQPLIDKLMFDVQGKITSALQNDWRTYSQNPTSAGSGYPSFAYLNKLASEIQTQFGVKVEVNEFARDYLSEEQLATLPDIGRSSSGQTIFAPYAMQLATTYLTHSGKVSPSNPTDLIRPAAPLEDISGNVYIFRLTDARAAQPAPNLTAVAGQVDLDLRKQSAYGFAKDAGGPLITAARNAGLITAASAMGKIIAIMPPFTNPFGTGRANLGKDVNLSPSGEKTFIDQAYGLLAQYDPNQNPHPINLISIPQDGKVYVAQLGHVEAPWNRENYYLLQLRMAAELHQIDVNKLRLGWLDYDAAVARLGYKPEASAKDSSS